MICNTDLLNMINYILVITHVKSAIIISGIKLSLPNIFFTVTKVFRKILVTLLQL